MTDPDPHRPLATLFVLAYRQEAHVRAAVEGAFAQTWSPLEIVLSDDCSPDGTFAVMEEMAAAYDGPHRVILSRNPENLGICAHIDRVVALSSGRLLVQNAGDDVSRPDRVEKLMAAWRASGPGGPEEAMTLYTPAAKIDAAGARIGRHDGDPRVAGRVDPAEALRHGMISLGATCAWSRRIFDEFGPLCGDMPEGDPLVEDLVTTFRSAALGRIVRLEEPLLQWRAGGLSWNESRRPGHAALFGKGLVYQRWREASYRAVLRDLDRRPVPEAEALRAVCRDRLAELRHTLALADAGPLGRLALAPGAAARSIARRDPYFVKQALKYLFAPAYMAYANARYSRRAAGAAAPELAGSA